MRAWLSQITLGIWLAAVCTRASVMFEPFPGWDADPFATVTAITGLGPASSLLLDVVIALVSAMVLVCSRRRIHFIGWAALIGSAAVVIRAMWRDSADAEPLAVAGAWSSGALAFAAATVVTNHLLLRRFAFAALLAFFCVLLTKGAGQFLVEHPAVVRSFELDPDGTLAIRGLEPGSAAALQFERRLRQPDITGWFGLSNVLAAFLVAGCAASAVLCWQRRRSVRHPAWLGAGGFCVLCGVGVAATGSKSGVAVLGCVLAAMTLSRLVPRLAAPAGLAVWLLPIAAILIRGTLGTSLDELSLLFRWFYLDTATDIAVANSPWGTGVDGFRASYAVLKPSHAPETVTSAHNAIADWIAMLGVFGVPLAIATIGAAVSASRQLAASSGTNAPGIPTRPVVLAFFLVFAVPIAISATLEAAATPIELALLRLLGLLMSVGVAASLFTLRATPSSVALAGLVLLTHSQLDMLLFHPGSIPLALVLIGLSCGRGFKLKMPPLPGAFVGVGVAAGLVVLCWKVTAWESALRQGFHAAQTYALSTQPQTGASWTNRSPDPTILAHSVKTAEAHLLDAAAAMPSDARAWVSITDLRLRMGEEFGSLEAARAAVDADRSGRTLGRLGFIAMSAAVQASGESQRDLIDEARAAWTAAAALDPHGPHFPGLLAELEADRGNLEAARAWSTEALSRHRSMALDPLAGLPDRRRTRLEDLVKADASGS